MNTISQLKQKHATKIRFGLVGVVNTAIDFGILFLLTNLFAIPKIPANVMSTSVAFVFSFFVNKKFTFKSHGKEGVVKQAILFTVVTLFGIWVVQSLVIIIVSPIATQLGASDNLALFISKFIATIASLVWNYLFYSKLVFRVTSEK